MYGSFRITDDDAATRLEQTESRSRVCDYYQTMKPLRVPSTRNFPTAPTAGGECLHSRRASGMRGCGNQLFDVLPPGTPSLLFLLPQTCQPGPVHFSGKHKGPEAQARCLLNHYQHKSVESTQWRVRRPRFGSPLHQGCEVCPHRSSLRHVV